MQAIHLPDRSLSALRDAIDTLAEQGARAIQLLGATANDWTPGTLDPLLAAAGVPVFGGLFPSIVFDGQASDHGAVLVGHRCPTRIAIVDILEGSALPDQWERDLEGFRTIVCYLDATCPSGFVLRALFNARGTQATWCGGGAGALDFVRRPVVITPQGLRAGVAVLAGLDARTSLGINHGWTPFGAPLLVTESRGNDVHTLDWRPAFDVYREAVEQHSGMRFAEHGFFDLASRYPLMIERFDAEGLVRDPLSVLEAGVIRFAGDVPQHSTIRVATCTIDDMIHAAVRARDQSVAGAGSAPGNVSLTIDCISRALLLGDRLATELQALKVDGSVQAGALTIGEIASSSDHLLQMHNKTTVLAVIEEDTQGR